MTTMTYDAPMTVREDLARRSITYRWIRPDVTPWEDGGTRAVELYVSHDKDRKHYTAGLNLIDMHTGFVSTRIARGHYLTVASLPVARYSAKTFHAFAEDALRVLEASLPHDPRAATLFAGMAF